MSNINIDRITYVSRFAQIAERIAAENKISTTMIQMGDEYIIPSKLMAQYAELVNLPLEGVLAQMTQIIAMKNDDYSNEHDAFSAFKYCEKLGIDVGTGIKVRMGDKIERLKNIRASKTTSVVTEKEQDTLLDLLNYSIILLVRESTDENITQLDGDVFISKITETCL